MPILNGEKYACESCIKGHRVSGCTHSDRPLKHINPKGRPVKQCEHCQKARKTKSHHARCDCGTKKDKAKAEKAAAAAAAASASESEHDAHVNIETALSLGAPSQGCACHLGEKCLCGMKKDLDLKLDTGFAKNGQLTKAKPRLTTAHSETTLTVFANGHHKPCHRLNNSAHTSGAPYRIPRHHTTHGGTVHKSHDNLAEMYSRTMDPARRSVDSLNLNNTAFGYFTPQSTAESVPMTPLAGSLENDCSIFDPTKYVYNQQGALGKMVGDAPEHHGLPMSESMPVHTYSWMNGGMYAPAPQYGVESISTSPTGDLTPDFDYNIPSAAADMTSNPYPWSAGDLPLDPNKLSDSLQPVSHSGESNRQSVPGMTTSSSGAQSEVGEPALFGDMDLNKMQQDPSVSDRQLINDPFQMRDPQSYRLSSASLSQQDVRPQMPTSVPANEPRQNLDLDFMQTSQDMAQPAAVFGTTALDSQPMFQTSAAASSGFSDAAFTAPDFSAPMNAPQAGLDTSAPANPQGADWYNILGTGMGVNAFSVPVETMNNQNAEFPTWL